MKKTVLSISLAILLFSCNKKGNGSNDANLNAQFDQYKAYFVDELWKISPEWASSQGFHNYDSILQLPTAENDRLQQLATHSAARVGC